MYTVNSNLKEGNIIDRAIPYQLSANALAPLVCGTELFERSFRRCCSTELRNGLPGDLRDAHNIETFERKLYNHPIRIKSVAVR